MLVLTRRPGQAIVIGDDLLRIEVAEILSGGRVRLGITAPDDLAVNRLEIYERIQRQEPAPIANEKRAKRLAAGKAVADWNNRYPIGTPVRFWSEQGEGAGEGVTISGAVLLGRDTPAVYLRPGQAVALQHVTPLDLATDLDQVADLHQDF